MTSRLVARLQQDWARPRPTPLVAVLWPLALCFGAVASMRRALYRAGWLGRWRAPVPVLVVGNLVAGGAGKTPATLALVQALRARGWRPGVVSRGHGRRGAGPALLGADATAAAVGDEPLLLHRRSQVPVAVGRDRSQAVRHLLQHRPEVDLVVCDDGLQHLRLWRDAELIVFDPRGAGNGLLLPAGPLREPLPRRLLPHQQVLYGHGTASTPLPGALGQRRLSGVSRLADWWQGLPPQPLATLPAARCLAAAGIASPEGFAQMLGAAGLEVELLPLPDHHGFGQLPWSGAPLVVVTEKDAVKLQPDRPGCEAVWVATLEQTVPAGLVEALDRLLRQFKSP